MANEKLKLNKELSVFNDFIVVNVFERYNKEKDYTKRLITVSHTYKPKDSETWKNTDFINATKIDKIIASLEEVKKKIEETKGGQK